jgi:hypothetical protein
VEEASGEALNQRFLTQIPGMLRRKAERLMRVRPAWQRARALGSPPDSFPTPIPSVNSQ